MNENNKIIILGAGPAGLAAGYELSKASQPVLILERENKVGGISRTESFAGHLFDLGPHRYFTKNKEVMNFWQKLLGSDFLEVPRLTRIYYKQKFFYYPLKPANALRNLGAKESVEVIASFFKARLDRLLNERQIKSFEDWMTDRFGKKLFEVFFKDYTEKLWGISTKDLSADWAAQRVKGLSLYKALKNAFLKSKAGKVRSLIEKFNYPSLGSGMMYDKIAAEIKEWGGEIKINSAVNKIRHRDCRIMSVATGSEKEEFFGNNFISSLPVNKFVWQLDPLPPAEVLTAAKNLKFRSIIFVALEIGRADVFPDIWLYVQEPRVKMTRITNFKNWSVDLIQEEGKTILILEYVGWEGDEVWQTQDEILIEFGKNELISMSLIKDGEVLGGRVVRVVDAYPIYAFEHEKNLKIIFDYLNQFKNLQTIGRSGMFRYNNMDHSVMSGFLAARNILSGKNYPAVLEMEVDEEYFEEERA